MEFASDPETLSKESTPTVLYFLAESILKVASSAHNVMLLGNPFLRQIVSGWKYQYLAMPAFSCCAFKCQGCGVFALEDSGRSRMHTNMQCNKQSCHQTGLFYHPSIKHSTPASHPFSIFDNGCSLEFTNDCLTQVFAGGKFDTDSSRSRQAGQGLAGIWPVSPVLPQQLALPDGRLAER